MAVNGQAITYSDTAPGLPVEYYNTKKSYEFTWNDLGQLYGGLVDGKVVTYQYNTDGLRTYKRANNQNHYYYYDGDRLIAEKLTTGYLLFHYDENDSIYSFTYNNGTTSTKYYLYKNLQGDVVQIRDKYNAVVANYSYDAWGNLVSITNNSGTDITSNTTGIAYINPIRYRGYYYDTETGFYYLQSRYYDPAIGRFISADRLIVNSTSAYGYNLFAYCGDNPVNASDPSGFITFWDITDIGFASYSWGKFASNPSWGNLGEALLDTVSLLPIVPSAGYFTKADDAIDIATGLLKSDLPLETVKTAGEISSSTTTVYRSISSAEAIDIKTTGQFNLSPYGMDSKQFGFDLFETRKFGEFFSQDIVVSAQLPTHMIPEFDVVPVDPFIFQHGTLTVHGNQLDLFNDLVQGTIHFVP